MPLIRRVQQVYHISNTVVASEIVRTSQGVDIRDVQELDERVPDIANNIHNRGGLCCANDPKVMGECEKWEVVRDCAELWVHSVIQNTSSLKCSLDGTSRCDLVCQSGNLKYIDKEPDRIRYKSDIPDS